MNPQLIDSHAHLDMLKDHSGALSRAADSQVVQIVTIGIDLATSQKAASLAKEHAQVFNTVGLHPHDASQAKQDGYWDQMKKLAQDSGAVAIGECGLDYYRNLSPKDDQRHAFTTQIELARELKIPLVIHDRDAHEEVVATLRQMNAQDVGGVVHCFSGDLAMARQVIEMGFSIGITGTITFPKNQELRDLVQQVPLDRLLVETDCPFLSPVPYRGKPNEPSYVVHTARALAQALDISFEELAAATRANTRRVFNLPELD